MRAFREGMSPLRAGLIALVVILIGSWFAFNKDIPFTQTYRVQAVFENSNLLTPRSPVRIAGVDVGKVVEVGRYKDSNMGLVTMEIQNSGRPVREDSTLKIRPRLFIEGNFYVDLKPGTPGSPEVSDGGTIPVTQTSTPVQLDQLLTSLQSDNRRSLQDTLIGFGEALDSEPSAADNADQDPDVQGLTGAQALNKAIVTGEGALRDSAIAGEALRGTQARDLSRTIRGIAGVSRGLARNENQLRDFITNFNITMGTLASEAPALSATIEELAPTAAHMKTGFDSIEAALPATTAWATAITPGMEATPGTIEAADPWLTQAIPLFGPKELGGLLKYATPATRDLASVTHTSREWVPKSDAFNRCVLEVIIPTGNIKVNDGPLSANTENYKEFWHAMVGQASEGQGFDGNGPILRLSAPGGSNTLTTGKTNYTNQPLFANATSRPLRTRPAFPNKVPPLRRDKACHTQPVPDVNGPASTGPADGSAPNAPAPPVPPTVNASSAPPLVPLNSIGSGQ